MKKIFTVLGIAAVATFANAQIVINEVYGGGGNSGATYTHDFVELINNGTTTATLSGATLQYASSTGTFNTYQVLPTISLTPGQTFLIRQAAGAGGTTALPTPDFIGTSLVNFNGTTNNATDGFAMSGTNMKIVLANNTTQVTSPTDTNVIDFVGIGSANQYEGSAAAPVMSNSTSVSRTNGVDTNNNSVDFTAGAPTPQNSASGSLSVSDIKNTKSNFVKNTFVKNNEITFGSDAKDVKIYTLNGQLVKTISVKANETLSVAELQKGNYIVTGTVSNQPVSQKILKD